MAEAPQRAGTIRVLGADVPRAGYGMGALARAAASDLGKDRARPVLERAFELGVRLFDTADFYADGLGNRLLAETFADRRDQILVATKVGTRTNPGGAIPLAAAQKPHELRATVEKNLEQLSTDHLDLVYIRRMDAEPGLLAEGEQVVPLDDQIAEMVSMRDEGVIRGIGLSHVSTRQVESARGAGIAAVQNIYNLVYRDDEELALASREEGRAWIPYFPLGGGFGTVPRVADFLPAREIAGERGVPVSQVGLAWILAHVPDSVVISGTSSIDHLEDNVAAASLEFGPGELALLENSPGSAVRRDY